ncbi:AfsR/SARP family transcriptional regulator [Micromonospora sp. AMSO12t]|uniref:AfsR/SARP family transcriptional regulator n=1 Tax=unclassified Micromonospora TaxID=2617518 RepID=UPI00124B2F5B|nr:AfsR/SARP family transcriptional regulator [Micromonospora sp. AMSO12t]KAB1162077.1 AfsR/SARP family transcriptional regulator [Micromonospora sp. AMSO12t]
MPLTDQEKCPENHIEEIRFQLLGPLEITGSTGPVLLTSARQRTVLAMLLIEAPCPVTMDRLVEAVWEDDPPSTARNQIQICISRLRQTFRQNGSTDLIETTASGYLLRTSESSIDVGAFRSFTEAARRAESAGQLADSVQHMRRALTLWRGKALSDIGGSLVRSIAAQLEESRLTLIDELVSMEHQIGCYGDSIEQLTQLVKDYPLRERLWAHFMTALHQTGRRADALLAYRAARDVLVAEVGIEPGEELRRVHGLILVDS